jgi:hypothetical protein
VLLVLVVTLAQFEIRSTGAAQGLRPTGPVPPAIGRAVVASFGTTAPLSGLGSRALQVVWSEGSERRRALPGAGDSGQRPIRALMHGIVLIALAVFPGFFRVGSFHVAG